MKKILLSLLTATIAGSFSTLAQPLRVGAEVKDIAFTDINGNAISLYGYLDQGYTVLVDISATWCGPCWSFEQTGIGQGLYEKYGPEGTVNPGKIIFLFIEGDPGTGRTDLFQKGSKSQGDWVTGKTHPIVDAADYSPIIHFSVPGATTVNFPTFLMICPDRKVVWNAEGVTASWDEAFFLSQAESCGKGVTGIEDAVSGISVALYPNPVTDLLHLDLKVREKSNATMTVSNMLGQELFREPLSLLPGLQNHVVSTSDLVKGVYILTIFSSDQGSVTYKFVKE